MRGREGTLKESSADGQELGHTYPSEMYVTRRGRTNEQSPQIATNFKYMQQISLSRRLSPNLL